MLQSIGVQPCHGCTSLEEHIEFLWRDSILLYEALYASAVVFKLFLRKTYG
ncbi:hypothetical protein [Peromfec virus RodF8_47]|uniref:Uncharacterized protein n=1 Tax=Peromfec virus RodF8_47 TaxID=2929378 RepID=A0A976R7Q1_9VIRU|nr:hypothetical protein [Peromfec virus RodF8_47]